MSNFDWNEDGSVVFGRREGIAVYTGANGHIVIRQSRDYDDDVVILIDRRDAQEVISALMDEASQPRE